MEGVESDVTKDPDLDCERQLLLLAYICHEFQTFLGQWRLEVSAYIENSRSSYLSFFFPVLE